MTTPSTNHICKYSDYCKAVECVPGCTIKPCKICNAEALEGRRVCWVCLYRQQKARIAEKPVDNDYFRRWRAAHAVSLREYNREYMRNRRIKNID